MHIDPAATHAACEAVRAYMLAGTYSDDKFRSRTADVHAAQEFARSELAIMRRCLGEAEALHRTQPTEERGLLVQALRFLVVRAEALVDATGA